MKKLVVLGLGISSIFSASVLAEGSSFYYALSNFASSQQAPPAMRESSLAAIEGGQLFPFFILSVPGVDPFSQVIAAATAAAAANDDNNDDNHTNIVDVRPRCDGSPCNHIINISQSLNQP